MSSIQSSLILNYLQYTVHTIPSKISFFRMFDVLIWYDNYYFDSKWVVIK